jgi:DNA polymerase-3 subunit delta'
MQYSLDFAKEIICEEYNEQISKQIDDNIYPELKIIESQNGVIKKEQLIELQESFSVKPVLGNKLVYIINSAEDLNSSSANTILKFLEEPSENIVAILLTDNLQKVISTVKSRCQIIVFNNDKKSENIVFDTYKKYYQESEYNDETFNYLVTGILDLIKKIDTKKIKTYIYYKTDITDIYKDKRDYLFLFDFILYFYYDMLNFKLHRDLMYMNKYTDYIEALDQENTFETITKKLQIIENTKNNLETNMNLKLLMDDFIIKMSEV